MNCLRMLVLGISTLAGANAMAAACDGFVDVDDSNAIYCSAVTYVKSHGVTLGCTDSTHYCPNDYVTRLQMALFLRRVGLADPSNTLGMSTDAVSGGQENVAADAAMYGYNVVAGGHLNMAEGGASAIGGGYYNVANGLYATVAGGNNNLASGTYSVAVGGNSNYAAGNASVALGQYASADQDNCMVISLWSSSLGLGETCGGNTNTIVVGMDHGMSIDYGTKNPDTGSGSRYVYVGDLSTTNTIAAWNGASLTNGGTWANASDRGLKTDFAPTDSQAVLAKVAAMPMDTWRYKSETGQRHIGPMAQDFYAAFGLGADDKHITTVDEGGVALAAIQGLNAKLEAEVQARDALIAALATKVQLLSAQVATFQTKQ